SAIFRQRSSKHSFRNFKQRPSLLEHSNNRVSGEPGAVQSTDAMLLPDPMTKTAVIFTAEYRRSGYTADEEQQLRSLLETLGPVRLRAHRLPAAGGSSELWLVASFIGGSMASGLIGHITTHLYDHLSEQLLAFFRIRKQRDGLEPEMTLTVS